MKEPIKDTLLIGESIQWDSNLRPLWHEACALPLHCATTTGVYKTSQALVHQFAVRQFFVLSISRGANFISRQWLHSIQLRLGQINQTLTWKESEILDPKILSGFFRSQPQKFRNENILKPPKIIDRYRERKNVRISGVCLVKMIESQFFDF